MNSKNRIISVSWVFSIYPNTSSFHSFAKISEHYIPKLTYFNTQNTTILVSYAMQYLLLSGIRNLYMSKGDVLEDGGGGGMIRE